MSHSIITEFQEELQLSPGPNTQSIFSKSQDLNGQELYMNKLEQKIKELKNQIRKNRPVIEQIKAQRKFLKKICEKQRHKIETTKIDLMKIEYENEIEQLRFERHKLQDVISVIHEESEIKCKEFGLAKEEINLNFIELSKYLQEIQIENRNHEEILYKTTEAIDIKKIDLKKISEEMRSKENVERKYKEILSAIKVAEN